MRLGIYGSGGVGREILELAKILNEKKKCFSEILFIDDTKKESLVESQKCFSFEQIIKMYPNDEIKICVAVGEPFFRSELKKKLYENHFTLQTLIHPNVFIPSNSVIGSGSVINSSCFISCNVHIGENVYLQPHMSIGHDSSIGADSVLSSGVTVCGNCTIGERSFIGVNVPIKEIISIGNDSIIGIGSVVIRDIPDNVIALGNPARPMKNNDDRRVF